MEAETDLIKSIWIPLILVYIFTQASLATLSEKAKTASEISVPVV